MRHLQTFGILYQNSVLGTPTHGNHNGGGSGQPKGAGAGNNQHRSHGKQGVG